MSVTFSTMGHQGDVVDSLQLGLGTTQNPALLFVTLCRVCNPQSFLSTLEAGIANITCSRCPEGAREKGVRS